MSDLISRQAAIGILYNFAGCIVDTPNGDYHRAYKASRHELELLPTTQPEQQWIPVTERLPEDGQNVLVTYKTTDKIHPCQYHDDGSRNPWYSYIDQCRAHMNVVLAWMPLPEPYREEGGQA